APVPAWGSLRRWEGGAVDDERITRPDNCGPPGWLLVVCICDRCRQMYWSYVSPEDKGPWHRAKQCQYRLQSTIASADGHPRGEGCYCLRRCARCSLRDASPTLRRTFAGALQINEWFIGETG